MRSFALQGVVQANPGGDKLPFELKAADKKALAEILIGSLKDEEDITRARAARLCSWLGPDANAAIPALVNALKDQNFHVKLCAVTALGSMGPTAKEAVPALEVLAAGPDNDGLQNAAAQALEKIRK